MSGEVLRELLLGGALIAMLVAIWANHRAMTHIDAHLRKLDEYLRAKEKAK